MRWAHNRLARTALVFVSLFAVGACCRGAAQTRSPGEIYIQEGVASWYGGDYQGKSTASGQPFDKEALTCAHPQLPFGTRLEVTYLKTGKRVVVEVNDRGPYYGGRIIDLSEAAARALGMIEDGKGRVRIVTLD